MINMAKILKSNFQADKVIISDFQYRVVRDFDADLPHDPLVNQEAIEQRGLVYDSQLRAYRDEDRCLIADEFGQPF